MTPDELRIRCADKTPNPKTLREEISDLVREKFQYAYELQEQAKISRSVALVIELKEAANKSRKEAVVLRAILDRTGE